MGNKKIRKRLFIPITLLLTAGIGVYFLFLNPRAKAKIDPSRLTIVERGAITRSVVATGRIEPISKVDVKSKANGIIKEIKVNIGDVVKPGQILAELDKETLAASLREARAGLLVSEANLKASIAQYEKNQVEAQSPEVKYARRSSDRAQKLIEAGVLSFQSYDDSRSALEQAENRQNVARSQLNVSQAQVSQADAEVAKGRAAVEGAEEDFNNATIRSPIHGIVLSRDVEIGSPVSSILNLGSAATLVMVLGDISQVFVRGKVDESDIGVVRLGQPSRIVVESFKDREFDGQVTQISPLGIDKENVVTFEVRVSINNSTGELKTNMTANAEIVLEHYKDQLTLPESAIIYDSQRKAWVEIPDPDSPNGRRRIPIKVGISNGMRAQVLEGLDEGQKVLLQ
ncbi:MAG: efflux RND transporter periplasmic adaptor subunit [Chloracidobacterium sp.]|nr:efflux RND transporter periplasmic adaptor subunit [Chloracidobacterium sp.]